MNWLKRLFSPSPASVATAGSSTLVPIQLEWLPDATMPIPDWRAAYRAAPKTDDAKTLDAYWRSAALAWLEALRANLGGGCSIMESPHFALLCGLPDRQRRLAIEYCERARGRILRSLDGIASDWGHGPHVVLIFEDDDQYYRYIGNYFPKSGEFAMSSGLFIQNGYGHFVFAASDMTAMEPIIAHELTHCLLAALPIPAWLNEGTAVNIENALVPHARDPRRGLFEHREQARDRKAFWNAETIQQFWSGKSFLLAGKGSSLSYDLATDLTRLLARDYGKYRDFMTQASNADGGSAATQAVFGFALADLAAAVLGDGPWTPQPASWSDGTERGQFRARAESVGPSP